MRKVSVLMSFLISILSLVNAQNKIAGYKGGNDSLIRIITKNLMRGEAAIEWGDSSIYVIAFFEVNEKGEIANLTLTSIKDTIGINIVANAIFGTKDNWMNNTGRSQFFEIPFYFFSSKSSAKPMVDKVPIINTTYFKDGEKTKFTMLSPITVISYPPVR